MEQADKRALLVNALLIAEADGQVDPLEQRFIQRFMKRAGISMGAAGRWWSEHREAGGGFLPVGDPARALDCLKVTIGVAAADGRLDPGERGALRQLVAALQLPEEGLQEALAEHWGADVVGQVFPPAP